MIAVLYSAVIDETSLPPALSKVMVYWFTFHFALRVFDSVASNGNVTKVSPSYHPANIYPAFSVTGSSSIIMPASAVIGATAVPPSVSNVIATVGVSIYCAVRVSLPFCTSDQSSNTKLPPGLYRVSPVPSVHPMKVLFSGTTGFSGGIVTVSPSP